MISLHSPPPIAPSNPVASRSSDRLSGLNGGSRPPRVDFLDQWRGLAVLFVFIYHCFGMAFGRYRLDWAGWVPDLHVTKSFLALFPATWGWAGVSIFFVISGFCIHCSFRQRPQLRTFFRARFFRIYPPYFFALLFFAAVYPVTRLELHSSLGKGQLLAHLFLVHNFGASVYAVTASFWSIAVEAQLYLLYPVLLVLVSRIGWRNGLIVVGCVEVSLRVLQTVLFMSAATPPPDWLILCCPLSYWYSWAIGAALAEAYLNGESLPFRNCSPVGLAAVGVACLLFKPFCFMAFPVAALATAAAIARMLAGSTSVWRLPDFCTEHLRRVGVWSYSVYLIHQPLVSGMGRLFYSFPALGSAHPLKIFVFCLISWIPVVMIASLYFRFCEQPSVRLGKMWSKLEVPNLQFPSRLSVADPS